MLCTRCEKPLADVARFCDRCGEPTLSKPEDVPLGETSQEKLGRRECPLCAEDTSAALSKCLHCGSKIVQTENTTLSSIFSDVQEAYRNAYARRTGSDVGSNKSLTIPKFSPKQLKWGSAAFVGLMCAVGVYLSEPPLRVEGDTGIIDFTVNTNMSETAGSNVAKAVYSAATGHHEIHRIQVNCFMDKSGISDNYGNAWEKNRFMGSFDVTDLDEVRKYRDSNSFVFGNSDFGKVFLYRIRQMQYAELLH